MRTLFCLFCLSLLLACESRPDVKIIYLNPPRPVAAQENPQSQSRLVASPQARKLMQRGTYVITTIVLDWGEALSSHVKKRKNQGADMKATMLCNGLTADVICSEKHCKAKICAYDN
jgi:hypothetical protein